MEKISFVTVGILGIALVFLLFSVPFVALSDMQNNCKRGWPPSVPYTKPDCSYGTMPILPK